MEPVKRKEQKGYAYNDIGKRLKEIREALNHTLDRMSVDSGISRSYLAEFERGFVCLPPFFPFFSEFPFDKLINL